MMNLKLLYACLVFFVALTTSAQQKVGFVYVDSLLQEMPEAKQADSSFQAEQTRWLKILTDLEVEIQKIADSMSRTGGCLGRYDWEPLKRHYDQKMFDYAGIEQKAQDSLRKYREEQYGKVKKQLNKLIADVALEQGFVTVLDASSEVVLYFDNRCNLTDEIRKKLTTSDK